MLKKPLVIPAGSFEAYLYDCDGTIAESMEAHVEAWVAEMAVHGVSLDPQLIYELAGMPATKTVEVMNQRYGVKLDPEVIAQAKEDRFFNHYMHRVQPIPVMVEHLKESAKTMKIAVVSGGRTRIVKATLKILGIESLVQALVCAEDVKKGKPDPEPFLMAAEKLGIEPSKCLVFEDADLGIQSAINAGMKWVRVEA